MRIDILVFASLAAVASAQVSPTGPFTGQLQEDFTQSQFGGACLNQSSFGGAATVCTPNGSTVSTTGGWSFQCYINAPYSGSLFYGSFGQATEFVFSTPIYGFGGYFSSNSGYADATVDFYDANNALIGSATAAIPADCIWRWQGWNACTPISRILVTGLNPYGGGFVMMDALEAGTNLPPQCTPTPTTYCTPGTSTNGCTPSMSALNNPNVAHSNSCIIDVAGVEGQKSGILFYSLAQFIQPWCSLGGGSSLLCVKAPTMRTIGQNAGGTAGTCDGALQLDWNAYQLANPTALGNPWAAGAVAYAQGWFRDPPACKTTFLSETLCMTYVP
jgi:hypothetical protein